VSKFNPLDPWAGYKPNTKKKYDDDTPKEVLEAFWGNDEDEDEECYSMSLPISRT